MHEQYLSLEKADLKQGNFAVDLNNFDEGIKTIEKSLF